MYRKFYSENNFEHYVFVREPLIEQLVGLKL